MSVQFNCMIISYPNLEKATKAFENSCRINSVSATGDEAWRGQRGL
jgi:hypothetical protein